MARRILMLLALGLGSPLAAAPITDPFVKNLTLVGVIHVEGAKAKGQSVAVLREKSTGKTRMLHKGDSILDADLEVSELGPQEIVLVRGTHRFVLRVENQVDTTPAYANHVETTEVELSAVETAPSTIVEIGNTEPATDKPLPEKIQRFEPKPASLNACEGEECPAVSP